MIFGTPVSLPNLLEAVAAQLAANGGYTADTVYVSLWEPSMQGEWPGSDQFAVITPPSLEEMANYWSGGGRYTDVFTMPVKIGLWNRNNGDQEFRSSKQTMAITSSLCSALANALNALEGWMPLAADGTCTLIQPASVKNASFGVRRPATGWVVLDVVVPLRAVIQLTPQTGPG